MEPTTRSQVESLLASIRERMPLGAWDTHFHTQNAPGTSHHLPVEAARTMHRSIGVQRGVMVQSRLHAARDEDFIADLESVPEWRGVALITESTTDAELDRLHAAGVRAIRLTYVGFLNRRPSVESFRRDVQRAADRGWHLLLHLEPNNLLELAGTIASLELPVVLDHCAHIRTGKGLDQPAVKTLLALHQLPHCWVKISSLDRWAPSGAPAYSEAIPLARAVLANAPERVLWATDWPHVMYKDPRNSVDEPPALGDLVQLLFASVGDDDSLLHQVLVDNPLRLYS